MRRLLLGCVLLVFLGQVVFAGAQGTPLLTFLELESWAEGARERLPKCVDIQILECVFGHAPVIVEDESMIEGLLLALEEVSVTSDTPDYSVATGTNTFYRFVMEDGKEVEIAFQNGSLLVDPGERDERLYPLSGAEPLIALTELLEEEQVEAAAQNRNKFSLDFDETPSTGYWWSLRIGDPEMISLVGEDFIRNSLNNLPGGDGGMHRYTFAVKQPGKSVVTFYRISHHNEVAEKEAYLITADESLRPVSVERME